MQFLKLLCCFGSSGIKGRCGKTTSPEAVLLNGAQIKNGFFLFCRENPRWSQNEAFQQHQRAASGATKPPQPSTRVCVMLGCSVRVLMKQPLPKEADNSCRCWAEELNQLKTTVPNRNWIITLPMRHKIRKSKCDLLLLCTKYYPATFVYRHIFWSIDF